MHPICSFRRPLLSIALVLADAVLALAGEPASTPDLLVYLDDAPEASVASLSQDGLSRRVGWVRLDEDSQTHRFAGCPVLSNDKLVAVLHKDNAEVELYARTARGLQRSARLLPICDGVSDLKPASFAIRENSRTAAAVAVELRSAGGQARSITYELTAGAPFLTATAGEGVQRLRVAAPCRFAVLPDFFGDDMLIDAAALPVAQAELPSENFLLHLLAGGDAMLLTVSESRDNEVRIALSATEPREIVASEVAFGTKGRSRIWIAVLAERGIWHSRDVALADAGQTLALDWKMPFPALWRVDWSTEDRLTDSWEMLLQQPDGKLVMQGWFGQDESFGQRFGAEFGPRDWNKPGRQRWNPVLGGFLFPCWVASDGQGFLQPLKARRYTEGGKIHNFTGPAVIYPLDRVKGPPATTPLDKLTVVDLVRLTLGVGPCQYILDLEGQKRNARGVATCYARDVINAIYKAGTQRQNQAEIESQLDAAVAFITNVRERIDAYVDFGRELRTYLTEQKRLCPQQAAFFDDLLAVTGRLDELFAEKRSAIHTPAYAQEQAQAFRDKLLNYEAPDAAKRCAEQMGVFTSIGGAQDGLVASCRMIVKTVRQRAVVALATNPELNGAVNEVRTRTQRMLRNPTPYEAPRH
jgi:hypothetical protein